MFFVYNIRVQLHSFACFPVFPVSFVEEVILIPLCILAIVVEQQLTVCVGLFLGSVFCFIMSVFMPVLCCLNYCSFVIYFEIRNCDTSRFVLSQDCFGILHLFILGRCLTGLYQNIFSCGNFCFMKWSYIIVIYAYLLND